MDVSVDPHPDPNNSLAASINIAPMTDLDDKHNESGVLDLIDDPIRALPKTISLLTRQLLATCRSRIIRQ
jgi:hypothetical protein